MKINVKSEIGKLKRVLVHRPGKEVERLYPDVFADLLFDDIMDIKVAQAEHDAFTAILEREGVQVVYVEKEVATILKDKKIKEKFIDEFIKESGVTIPAIIAVIKDFWGQISDELELVRAMIAGIKKTEVTPKFEKNLESYVAQHDDYPFYIDPIPNLLFQRDTMASALNGMNIHNMWAVTRQREQIFYRFLNEYHPEWKSIPVYYSEKDGRGSIEGGDILVMNEETLFVGISQRTMAVAVEDYAKKIFAKEPGLKQIVGIEIPKSRGSMHLDTILTQMDYDKFSIDADFASLSWDVYIITREGIKVENVKIIDLLKKYVHKDASLVIVGGGDPVRAKREQWNDGANCLAIAPGVIVTYSRNYITNELMRKAGITVHEVPSSELSRGRGGPRCMSMPLDREDLQAKK